MWIHPFNPQTPQDLHIAGINKHLIFKAWPFMQPNSCYSMTKTDSQAPHEYSEEYNSQEDFF